MGHHRTGPDLDAAVHVTDVVTGTIKNGVTRLAVGRRVGARISLLPLAEIGIARLVQFDRPKEWSF